MQHVHPPILSNVLVAERTWLLTCRAPEVARTAKPGQFVNIRVEAGIVPLLRRPLSISRVKGEDVEFLYTVVGPGTTALSKKQPGETLDLVGPLGTGFRTDAEFSTAIFVAGGVGVAPFPFLADHLRARSRRMISLVGARSAAMLFTEGLEHVHVATDDGTDGYHGNVVDLLRSLLEKNELAGAKCFGCGPTAMLKALQSLALERTISCELSLEGEMACGIGICQGCPVRRQGSGTTYALTCTDGPSFDATEIILE
jgi:dihydroorotate dehydrogenase electron transfer subunit